MANAEEMLEEYKQELKERWESIDLPIQNDSIEYYKKMLNRYEAFSSNSDPKFSGYADLIKNDIKNALEDNIFRK